MLYHSSSIIKAVTFQRLQWAVHNQHDVESKFGCNKTTGRPRQSWRNYIAEELQIMGFHNWMEAMMDRDQWWQKKLCNKKPHWNVMLL